MANDFSHSLRTYDESKRSYEIAKAGSDLSTILQITEPTLKLSLADLLGEMAYQRDGNITYFNQKINVESKVSEILDSIYGKNNYYLEIVPPPVHIRIVFVIDGSESLLNDLQSIKQVLPAVQNYFKNEFTLETIVYILRFNSKVSCDSINFGLGVKCIDQNLSDFSNKFSDFTQSDCPKKGVGIYNEYFENTLKNPESPFFLGTDGQSLDQNGKYICKRIGGGVYENYLRIVKGLYYEDWATGTAYAAKDINLGKLNAAESVLTMIFPVSDELSTGSESDLTYTLDKNFFGMREKHKMMYFDKRSHLSICDTDDANGRFKRAQKTIDHAIHVLRDFDYRVFPILTDPSTVLDENSNPKICTIDGNMFTFGSIPPRHYCCSDPLRTYCQECSESKGFHFHDRIKKEIINDMTELANATNGKLIDISAGYDESILKNSLLSAIAGIVSRKFVFGAKKENVERYAINRAIPLLGNKAVEVKFWAYKEKDSLSTEYVSPLEIKPVAVANVSPSMAVLRGDDNVLINFWSTSFSPNGYDIRKIIWEEGQSILSNDKNFSKVYSRDQNGLHRIKLTVIDSKGNTDSSEVTILIKSAKN